AMMRVLPDVSQRFDRTTAQVHQSWRVQLGRGFLKPCGGERKDAAKPTAAAPPLELGTPSIGRAPHPFKNTGQLRRHLCHSSPEDVVPVGRLCQRFLRALHEPTQALLTLPRLSDPVGVVNQAKITSTAIAQFGTAGSASATWPRTKCSGWSGASNR